jgi:hypothetical protein
MSNKVGMEVDKGKTKATPKLSKLAPSQTPLALSNPPQFVPYPTEAVMATHTAPPQLVLVRQQPYAHCS